MTLSKALFFLCISFIGGISLQSIFKTPQALAWGVLVIGVMCVAVGLFSNEKTWRFMGFCLLFIVLGMARMLLFEFNMQEDALRVFHQNAAPLQVRGYIAREPHMAETHQSVVLRVQRIVVGNREITVDGLVLVTLDAHLEYRYLDHLVLEGRLKPPDELGGFDYAGFLAKDGIYSTMDFPKVTEVSQEHEHYFFSYGYEKILLFKDALRQSIYRHIPSPESQILEGIVLGTSKNISKEMREKVNAAGLSHVIAVSGTHIVIISSLLLSLLLLMGFWRQQACCISIFFIWAYIVLIGFPASGVRSAIMGTFFLAAQALGRQNASSRTIVLAAALMLFQNPLILFHDVGFQLSFLASLGIIHAKPLCDDFLMRWRAKGKVAHVLDMMVITLIAQLSTIPLIMHHFKTVSFVSPITNFLILPVVYWLMVFGFLASLLGIISGALGFIFAVPAWFLLFYFVKVVEVFYQPWAKASISLSWMWVLAYYGAAAVIIWFLKKKQMLSFLKY